MELYTLGLHDKRYEISTHLFSPFIPRSDSDVGMGTYNVIPRSEATWGSPVVQYEIATSGIALLAMTLTLSSSLAMAEKTNARNNNLLHA